MNAELNEMDLPGLGFLESLVAEEREELKSLGEGLVAADGDTVIAEGDSQNFLYVLLSGKAKVLQKRVAPAVTAWLSPGESFGEVNLFDLEEAGASASVVAEGECLLWRVDRNGLNSFIESYPSASLRVMIGISTLLSKRLRAMNETVKEMSVWTRA